MLLATDIPTEIIRERGFADFCIYALVALGIAEKIWSWVRPSERKISGKVQTEPAIEHADQSDLDELTKTVNSMRDEITAQFREAQRSGENRVSAITQDVNAEMSGLSMKIGEMTKLITAALVDNAKQSAEIGSLQSSIFRHDAEVREVQARIAELMRAPHKRTA